MEKAERKIEEVSSIVIRKDEILIYHGTPIPERFKREKWRIRVEDAHRIDDDPSLFAQFDPREAPGSATVITVRGGIGVGCQILEKEKTILCGERPEEMFID